MHSDHHAAKTGTWTVASIEVPGRPARAAKAALKASDAVQRLGLDVNTTVLSLPGGPVALAAIWEPSGTLSGWDAFKDAIQGACLITGITGLPETGLTIAVTTIDPGEHSSRR